MTPLPPRIEVIEPDAGRIRFAPVVVPTTKVIRRRGPATVAVGALTGLSLLLLGIPTLAVVGLVVEQFQRAPWLGWATALTAGAGFGLLLWSVARELSALSRLRSIDVIRDELTRPEDGRRLRALRRWEALLQDAGHSQAGLTTPIHDTAAAIAVARAGTGAALRREADALGRTAAIQVAAGIAAVPSPSLDALLVGWRALRLVREVASLYGVRPGLFATLSLLRKALLAATLVGGVEAATNAAAFALLSNPLLARLAGEVAGVGVAARRMLVLARAVAAACDPLPPE